MTRILDIRGTHGAGKSYMVRKLMSGCAVQSLISEAGDLVGTWVPSLRCAILGTYTVTCGGCDQIKTADEVVRRVEDFVNLGDYVVLEGILVAHTFKRYNDLAVRMEAAGHEYVFCFIDVDLETCIRRVNARRAAKGQGPVDASKHVEPDYRLIHHRVRQRMIDAGRTVADIQYYVDFRRLFN